MTRTVFRVARRLPRFAAYIAAVLLLAALTACEKAPPKLLVFDTVLVDLMSSGTGETFTTPEDRALVKVVSETLRKEIGAKGAYRLLAPAGGANPEDFDLTCADCVLDAARAQGADYILTSAITRFSNATLFLKFEVDDVAANKPVTIAVTQVNAFIEKPLRQAALEAAKKIPAPGEAAGGADQAASKE